MSRRYAYVHICHVHAARCRHEKIGTDNAMRPRHEFTPLMMSSLEGAETVQRGAASEHMFIYAR